MHVRKMILFEELVRPVEWGGDLENNLIHVIIKKLFKMPI
jgi:hypothetical protein